MPPEVGSAIIVVLVRFCFDLPHGYSSKGNSDSLERLVSQPIGVGLQLVTCPALPGVPTRKISKLNVFRGASACCVRSRDHFRDNLWHCAVEATSQESPMDSTTTSTA